ncbi:MAG TPA: hypothetical protein VHV30_01715 [Polyangiaceae bacterium]|jgi:hypothetical protein|nr:hypothetical protein [Polyangiaceae bacterium]
MPVEDLRENPFFVLGIPLEASRADVERAGQRLLAELAMKRAAALTYATPLGVEERTADRVRLAVSELRDPRRRLFHETWARVAPAPAPATAGAPALAWSDAARVFGLRRR